MRRTLAGKHRKGWIGGCGAPSGWKGVKADLKKVAEFFKPSYQAQLQSLFSDFPSEWALSGESLGVYGLGLPLLDSGVPEVIQYTAPLGAET
jgi:hypothetical protein